MMDQVVLLEESSRGDTQPELHPYRFLRTAGRLPLQVTAQAGQDKGHDEGVMEASATTVTRDHEHFHTLV
jgi:hypothetical protein